MGDDLTGLEDGQKYQWKKNKVKITVKKILNLRIWQINFGKVWDSTAFHHRLPCLECFSLLLFIEEAEQLQGMLRQKYCQESTYASAYACLSQVL